MPAATRESCRSRTICEAWHSTQTAVLGDSVELTPGYDIWWSYIPHFIRTPGYVYAYAFGFLFSLAIYNRYLIEGDVADRALLRPAPRRRLRQAGGAGAQRGPRRSRPEVLGRAAWSRSTPC